MRRPLVHIAALAALAAAVGCRTPGQDPITKCFVNATNDYWDIAGLDVDVSSPDRCPFEIASGLFQEQVFEGIVVGNPAYIQGNGYGDPYFNSVVGVRVFNRLTDLVNKLGTVPTNFFTGNNPPRSQARVAYLAGSVGYANPFDTKGTDRGFLDVNLRDPSKTLAQGRADLTFTYTVAAAISGPEYVTGGTNFSLATSASNYRPALTYRWWKNGVLMNGMTWTGFTTVAPVAGASVTYKVEMTDADGDKGTATHIVRGTSPPPPGGGGGGGGCLRLKPDSAPGQGVYHVDDSVSSNALPCPTPP
jgi:hypothetical protein